MQNQPISDGKYLSDWWMTHQVVKVHFPDVYESLLGKCRVQHGSSRKMCWFQKAHIRPPRLDDISPVRSRHKFCYQQGRSIDDKLLKTCPCPLWGSSLFIWESTSESDKLDAEHLGSRPCPKPPKLVCIASDPREPNPSSTGSALIYDEGIWDSDYSQPF